MMKYVPRELIAEIEAAGVPWHLEQGKRHIKLFIGKKLAGIMPARNDEANRRSQLNIRAQVRRAIKEVQLG